MYTETYPDYLPSNMEYSATNMAGLQTNMDFKIKSKYLFPDLQQ